MRVIHLHCCYVQTLHSSGVDVLGAPIAAGSLAPNLLDGPFAWRALLPDGTLIKSAVTAGSAARPDTSPVAAQGDGVISIMHPDGSMSRQQPGAVELTDGTSITAAGWLHTSVDGHQSWQLDAGGVEDLKATAAKAAADAATAAEAAANAAAAEAAAAELAAASKKGGKSADKRALDKQKTIPAPSTGADAAACGANGAALATGAGADPAALHTMLESLQDQEPQERASIIRTAKLTDPDTQAVVVTREDHLMVVNYVGGNRLLQVRRAPVSFWNATMGYCARGCASGGPAVMCAKPAVWCHCRPLVLRCRLSMMVTTENAKHMLALASARLHLPSGMGALRVMGTWLAADHTSAPTCKLVHFYLHHALLPWVQDAEGCRISFLNHGWVFEGSAMPVVRGDELSVTVDVCPGNDCYTSCQC